MNQPPSEIEIEPGTIADAAEIARLHVEVWRETYSGLAPAAALTTLDEERRLPYWHAALQSGDPQTGVLLGRSGAQIDGIVSFGPSRDPALGAAMEIKHLYVRRPARRSGLGRRLMRAALAHLCNAGHTEIALAVVRENDRARQFYRDMGGIETGAFRDPGPLWRSQNIVVTWHMTWHMEPGADHALDEI